MRTIASALLITVAYITTANAWDNTPPIPERVVGLGEGKGKLNVDFEIHYDLMCSASAALHPAFTQFLDLPYLEGKVRDYVTAEYLFQPLPYHHTSWIPHKLVPYFTDECYTQPNNSESEGESKCRYIDYMNFSFKN